MPDWQFDYLLALSRIKQRLKQWLYNGYPVTSSKPRQLVSADDLSAALKGVAQNLKGITQKKVLNKSLSKMPLDASELLAQLSGKGLPDYSQVHQPETVMLYPVFILPQSASNRLEEAQGVEYVGKGCIICLTIFKKTDDVVQTSCSHLFHMHCLKQWLTEDATGERVNVCPTCQQEQGALGGFLTSKKEGTIASSESVALQEVAQIVGEMQAKTRTWPEHDDRVFSLLSSAERSSDPTIVGQAKALRSLASFYSVQDLVFRFQAGIQTWPENDGWVFSFLVLAEVNSDPTIAGRAQTLRSLVSFYSLQDLISRFQAGNRTWPEHDGWVFSFLALAEGYSDPTIVGQAKALRPLVSFYSVQELVSRFQARTQTWPERDNLVFNVLKVAEGSSNPIIAGRAKALRPLVSFYSVQDLVSRFQAGSRTWPERDGWVFDFLDLAERCSDPAIARQAQALRQLANKWPKK